MMPVVVEYLKAAFLELYIVIKLLHLSCPCHSDPYFISCYD